MWLRASLPRTSKNKPVYCCTPIIDGGKFLSRTPKCYLRQSCAHDPKDSKIDPLVHARKRQVDREPSLVIGRGHLSWSTLSLLALTRQKHLAKLSQVPNQGMSLPRLPFSEERLLRPLRQDRLRFFCDKREMGPQETTRKNKIMFYLASTYAFGSMFSTDALRNESKRMVSQIA